MVAAPVLWSTAGVVTRHVQGGTPFEMVFWRSLFAFGCAAALLLAGGRWFALTRPVLVSGAMCVAQQAKPAAKPARTHTMAAASKVPVIKYEKYKLKNGLEVILSENHRLPLVAVDIWYHVGPANEREGRTGFAHLFEHMMFQGSGHVDANEHFRQLEAAGASDINGTTDFDRTNYFETMPSNKLETALWLESDRMGWLLDKLDEKKLANQRDVVRNERRQGGNSPYEVVNEGMWHQLFPKGHPYYGDVIGSHADIEAAELKDVRDFFKTYYAPNNATIAIVGDYDPKTIKGLVEKYFGRLPAAKGLPFVPDDYARVLSDARARSVPLVVDAWAPW